MPSTQHSPPLHPGLYVKEAIIPGGENVTSAAKRMGIGRPALSNFLNGKSALSSQMATRLEKTFGADKEKLLQMQKAYDQYQNSAQERSIAVKTYTPDFLTIKAREIEMWADGNLDARALLPAFLRRLALTSGSSIKHIDFPAYDNSQRHGWDGEIEAENATPWVPEGLSGWEFGCNDKPQPKASKDYNARTTGLQKVAPEIRAKTTFVFVTPRNWNGKEKWVKEKRAEGEWKDVRAYDASDLEQWLDTSIPGQVWMAKQISLPHDECQTLADYWDEWSSITTKPISPKIFENNIAHHQQRIEQWLDNESSEPLFITADSKDEALAFLASTALNTDALQTLAEQAVLVASADVAKKLSVAKANFIPIVHTSQAETELARSGHKGHLIVVIEKGRAGGTNAITVERPSYEAFRSALSEMGFGDAEIERRSNETAKSPTILRRRLAKLPAMQVPPWALVNARVKSIIPFMFAGSWKANSTDDQEILKLLAGSDYGDIEKQVADLSAIDDAPLWSEESYRGVVSKLDCLNAIANQITVQDLDNFFFAAELVLSEDDPALDLPEDQRWAANMYEKVRNHSAAIRKGLCESLIVLSIYGDDLFGSRLGVSVENQVSFLVRKLLEDQGVRVWQSQQGELPMYAEAAPDTFMEIIESELKKDKPAFEALFKNVDGNVMFSRCERTGMLWALELLAWHPKRLSRISCILADLCRYKLEDNWAHKPILTLSDILLSWHPHTSATLTERCDVLELMFAKYPDVGWELCMSELKDGISSTSGTYNPNWRDDAEISESGVTHKDRIDFITKCRELVLSRTDHNVDTLSDLVSCLSWMNETDKNVVIGHIKSWLTSQPEDYEIIKLREHVRTSTLTYRSRLRHADKSSGYADGKMIYELLEPSDVVLKHQWLFAKDWIEFSPEDLVEEELDHDEREKLLNDQKIAALKEIIDQAGYEGLIRLTTSGEGGFNLGFTLGKYVFTKSDCLEFMRLCIFRENPDEMDAIDKCISGIIHQFQTEDIADFVANILETINERTNDISYQVRVLKKSPFVKPVWDLTEGLGSDIHDAYWSSVYPGWLRKEEGHFNYVIDKLLQMNRPKAAFSALHFHPECVEANKLIKVLDTMGTSQSEPEGHYLAAPHDLESAFASLDERDDVDRNKLAQLEYLYIEVLRPSNKYKFPNLAKELATSPLTFVQMIALSYKRNDGGIDPEEWGHSMSEGQRKHAAKRAYKTLDAASVIPGQNQNGSIDIDVLRNWIFEVRKLAKECDRLEIADQKIGHILYHCKVGSDGIWPQHEVRQILEEFPIQDISIGMEIGLYNSRGASFRSVDSNAELGLAEKYHKYAKAVRNEAPFTGRMLERIAKQYERDAEWWNSEDRVRRRLRE